MARMNIEGAELYDCTFKSGNRQGIATLPDAAATLAQGAPQVLVMAPTSTRIVKLPPSPRRGQTVTIVNTAAGAVSITVQDSAGAALPVALSVAQNTSATVVWDGAKWIGIKSA